MKVDLLIIICFLSLNKISSGQEWNMKTEMIDTLQTKNIVSDEGHWFGIRLGWQTKPYNVYWDWKLSDWWTLFAEYEYHLDKNWSLLADYHLFREKRCFECEAKNKSTIIGVGIKLGYQILYPIKLSAEGGIAFGPIHCGGFDFRYGSSIDITLNKDFRINFNLKTSIVPDYGYWITTGLKYKILN